MADPTFDGTNKTITLGAGVTSITAQRDLYSAWKRWVTDGDGSQYDVAFDNSFGGNDVGGKYVGAYFIFRNDLGWRIIPDAANHELTVEGNLYPVAPATPMFTSPGAYTVTIYLDRSVNAQVVGASELAAAVWDAPETSHTTTGTFGPLLTLLRKIVNPKKHTLSTTQETVYDDDGTTPIVTYTAKDKDGNNVVLNVGDPASRER